MILMSFLIEQDEAIVPIISELMVIVLCEDSSSQGFTVPLCRTKKGI